jgi:outer membrane protein assembly factor BamB
VIVGGVAIAVGRDAVYGIDLETGRARWEIPRSGGPVSVPAVVSGGNGRAVLLYLDGPAEGDGATPSPSASPTPTTTPGAAAETDVSELVAVDLEGRTERWRARLGSTSRTGVAVDDGVAYVGDEGGTVYAFDVADGAARWSADPAADVARAVGGDAEPLAAPRIDGPVAVADGLVISTVRSVEDRSVVLAAYDAGSGELAWPTDAESPAVSQVGSTASAPAAADGIVVVGTADRLVRAFGADGADEWSHLILTFFLPWTAPAVVSGAVYVADVGGGVYRLDAEDGSRHWSFQLNEAVLRSSPVLSGGAVLIGLNDGRLVALDAETGHLVWESEATPGLVGTIAVSDDVVVAVKGGRDAGLIAFEHDAVGSVVDVPSPTELDPATTFARLGIAAAIALAVVLVPGILARRRFGDALPGGGGDGSGDPSEDDAGDDGEEDEPE